ncbi:LysM peptidoglycan-binding domain-containing protein [Psychroflexus sp. YR1-1]|uniref:Peptidoglycan hydrolase n=1 Tax=Psychroflexus aurantiacus TaxID=2709310 RepID=A0A6B3QYI8_9FLAO|nr:glucosaminidase domain-containing protein [Psychroflexus aurantiacus]NEV93199.1 LysM peptidoglycan-binding domain-containing protein [Psychroflexus aurantiacus]
MKYRFAFSLFFLFMMMSCGTSKKTKSASAENSRTQQTTSNAEPAAAIRKTDLEDSVKEEEGTLDLTSLNPVERYIYDYAGIAQEEMKLYGIPASITIAQGILESGSGSGNLTRKSNNHFGIKCNGWHGEKVYHDDDEAQECFRKYSNPQYSFRDHSLFLFERSRYGFLFDYKPDDYKSWAKGLKKAGYATDPRYPDKLISLIERYQLHAYDKEVLGKNADLPLPKPQRLTPIGSDYYSVKKGDTLYNISQRFNLSLEELKLINKLKNDHIQVGQQLKVKF